MESNVITTGPVSFGLALPEAIRAVNIGSFVIAHNVIHCHWPDPDAVGIGLLQRGYQHQGVRERQCCKQQHDRGRAAVAVDVFNSGIPANTAFLLNDFEDFTASVAAVVVGNGVSDTLILQHQDTVNDQGINTVILPFEGRPRSVQ